MQDDMETMAGGDGISIHSGFPNPAADRQSGGQGLALDLNRLLIRHSSSTYLFRVVGHHSANQGVYDGDVAIIDRAVQARASDLIITWHDGEARLRRQHQLTPDDQPWGVVTAIVHQYRQF